MNWERLLSRFISQLWVAMRQASRNAPDDEAMVRRYHRLAKWGNAEAQYNLGCLYGMGRGVERNLAKAAYWLRKSAEQGYADAQATLGPMYESGDGVRQDYAKAFYWCHKLAEQGDADAQYSLGAMYHEGRGVAQDTEAAVRWYHKSAECGYVVAQLCLANLYLNGEGAARDYVLAYKWYHLVAAGSEHQEASDVAGKLLDALESAMNPQQIAQAKTLAEKALAIVFS